MKSWLGLGDKGLGSWCRVFGLHWMVGVGGQSHWAGDPAEGGWLETSTEGSTPLPHPRPHEPPRDLHSILAENLVFVAETAWI